MNSKKFVCFYPTRPFWAGQKPKIKKFGPKYYLPEEFNEIMAQFTREYSNNGYEMKICKDGLFCFRLKDLASDKDEKIEKIVEKWQKYLEYLNCIYLLFESIFLEKMDLSYFEITEITSKDAFVVDIEKKGIKGMSVPTESYSEQYVKGRWLNSYSNASPYYDWRIQSRISVPLEIFDKLNSALGKIFDSCNLIQTLSQVTKSLGEYKVGNYKISLILSWFILETFINEDWDKFLEEKNEIYEDGEKRINRKRMEDVLKDDRTYTVSVMLNVLELNKCIDYGQFNILDGLRRKRNEIVHGDEDVKVSPTECKKALNLVLVYLEKYYGLKLKLNYSYSVIGV